MKTRDEHIAAINFHRRVSVVAILVMAIAAGVLTYLVLEVALR